MKLLILTKNILAETSFQSKLQQMNNEVFCSTCLLDACHSMDQEMNHLLSCFDAVILSETISYQEIVDLISNIREYVPAIVRKYESEFTKGFEEEQTEYVIDQRIKSDASLEEIRELCQAIRPKSSEIRKESSFVYSKKKTPEINYHFYNFGFSKRESRMLMCLYENRGRYLSRQEMCQKIWNEESASDSKMSALSSCVRNIKEKVGKSGVDFNPIDTAWGRGYQMSDEFYQLIQTEAKLKKSDAHQILNVPENIFL